MKIVKVKISDYRGNFKRGGVTHIVCEDFSPFNCFRRALCGVLPVKEVNLKGWLSSDQEVSCRNCLKGQNSRLRAEERKQQKETDTQVKNSYFAPSEE